MGCVISPLLFVLAMEIILRSAANASKGVKKNKHLTLPPSRAFMDDITVLVPSQIAADGLLQRYYNFFTWERMKAKPKKIRSLSLVGGSVREIHFKIVGNKIQTVREKPVKNLGRLYLLLLTDRHRGIEVQKVALKDLNQLIKLVYPEDEGLVLPKWSATPSLWSLQMYEIAIPRVERIQQYSNKYLCKWLGVPPCFLKEGLYTILETYRPTRSFRRCIQK